MTMQPVTKIARSTELEDVAPSRIQNEPKISERIYPDYAYEQKFTVKLMVLMVAYVGTYFALMVHVTGSGLLGQSIVAVIGGSSSVTWLTLAVIIYTIILGPSVAQAADLWGRKWFVVIGTASGVVGCIITARANSIGMAIAGQAIAGLAQTTQGLTTAIMSEILPRKYRPMAQATIMTSIGLGAVVALYVAGAMCRNNPEGFRNYFYFIAAVFFVTSILFALFYNPPAREMQYFSTRARLRQFDYGGALLTLVAFLGISIGLGWSQNPYNWHDAHVLTPFIIGICGFLCLILYAIFVKRDGIYHRELFTSRNFVVAEICFFAEGFAFLTFNNYVPFQIEFVYGKNVFQTALEYSIAWYVCVIAALLAGWYCSRTKSIRWPVMVSFAIMAIYYGLMASTNPSTVKQPWGYAVLYGFSIGVTLNILVVLAQMAVPPQFIATASGLMLGTRAGGGTVSLAAGNAVFNSALSDNLGPKISKAALSHGLPPSSLGELIGALTSHNEAVMANVPGVTPEIIEVSASAMKDASTVGFRNVYIMTAAIASFGMLASFFINDPRDQFTSVVDAPLEPNDNPKPVESEQVETV